MKDFDGIKGLQGREPLGAAVTIGIKSSRGFPTETDRFHIVQVKEDNGVRRPHPAFSAFNQAPPEHRKILRGNLVHATREECFEFHLKAQVIKSKHPNRLPACVGDGVHAKRWEGPGPDDFFSIRCPNEKCEYRLTKPPKCKPFSRLYFRLRWKEGSNLPAILVKFTTGAWSTTSNLVGFFNYIDKAARQLHIPNYSLFGLPFSMELTKGTKPSEKTSFPVVTIASEIDPIRFFQQQAVMLKELAASGSYSAPALTDQSEQDPDVVYSDVSSISHPGEFS